MRNRDVRVIIDKCLQAKRDGAGQATHVIQVTPHLSIYTRLHQMGYLQILQCFQVYVSGNSVCRMIA